MLRLDDILITQGDFALRADLAVPPRCITAVIGASGCGKSTLLNALGGFVPIASGRIIMNDVDVTEFDPGERPIAMLFQDNNLFPHLSIAQNVALGLRPSLRTTNADKSVVKDALARVNLSGFESKKPGELSGGQQSRAALARVLVQSQPVVLLDEPFSALGPAQRAEMLDLVAALITEADANMIMVTHAPEDARQIADNIIHIDAGRAGVPQLTADALDNPPPSLKAYLGTPTP